MTDLVVGLKVKRKPKYLGGIWESICKKKGLKQDGIFTISRITLEGLFRLSGLENNFFGLTTYFEVVSEEKETKQPKPDWVIRGYIYGGYQTYQFKTRQEAREQVQYLKDYYRNDASELTAHRLTIAADGSMILTPTKL